DYGRGLVLRERRSSGAADGQESLGAVAPHPGQETGGALAREFAGDGFEEDVDRRPARMPFGVRGETKLPLPDDEVTVGGRQDHPPLAHLGQGFAVLRVGNPERRQSVQPLRETLREGTSEMDDEQDWNGKIDGEPLENFHHGSRTS